jgi:hypothetical protein
VRARPGKERDATVSASEQLDRLHRHHAQRVVADREVERPRVGADGLDVHSSRALIKRVEQRPIAIDSRDSITGACERQRDTPGPGADIEHRPVGALGELQPGRQVDPIPAALEVMPDDRSLRRRRPGS